MTNAGGNRRALLATQTTLNGIDFIEVASYDQRELEVHFINREPDLDALRDALQKVSIVGGESISEIEVLPTVPSDWSEDNAKRPILNVKVAAPGDFSLYTLRLRPLRPAHHPPSQRRE